jgi:hypothetical protein
MTNQYFTVKNSGLPPLNILGFSQGTQLNDTGQSFTFLDMDVNNEVVNKKLFSSPGSPSTTNFDVFSYYFDGTHYYLGMASSAGINYVGFIKMNVQGEIVLTKTAQQMLGFGYSPTATFIINEIIPDGDDLIICTGPITVTSSYQPVNVMKINKNGELIWARYGGDPAYSTIANISVKSVTVDNEFYYTFITANTQMALADRNTLYKFRKSNGELIWKRAPFGTTTTDNYQVVTDEVGGIYCVGRRGLNRSIVKYNADGDLIWSNDSNGDGYYVRPFRNPQTGIIDSVILFAANVGIRKFSLDGTILWQTWFSSFTPILDRKGTLCIKNGIIYYVFNGATGSIYIVSGVTGSFVKVKTLGLIPVTNITPGVSFPANSIVAINVLD